MTIFSNYWYVCIYYVTSNCIISIYLKEKLTFFSNEYQPFLYKLLRRLFFFFFENVEVGI